jgi:hypothetical protein
MKIYGGDKHIYWIFIESVVEEREGSPLSQFRLNLLQKLYMFSAHIISKVYTCIYKGSYGNNANFLENAKIVNTGV